MSLRRKSCDACHKGRRKCDRGYPTCGACQRTKKSCHYAYVPKSPAIPLSNSITPGDMRSSGGTLHFTNGASLKTLTKSIKTFAKRHHSPAHAASSRASPTTSPACNIPNYLGGLGEIQRVEGSTDSWQWAINELKKCPHDLARHGETLFLHPQLYRDAMPRAIRAVLGVSATFTLLNDDNHKLIFRVLDAEVLELLKTTPPALDVGAAAAGQTHTGRKDSWTFKNRSTLTLIEELARLQAFTLYQMIRMFSGGLEQRVIAQQQQGLLTACFGDCSLSWPKKRNGQGPRQVQEDWHAWIVAESIRRTAMTVYMFYGLYSMALHGFCADFATLAKLPVSTSLGLWQSEAAHMARHRGGNEVHRTLTYEAYVQCWAVAPPKKMTPFEKFLVVPCKGFEGIAAYGCSNA
ncbi:Zn(2)-C6 fungal-type DNA-binding domain protein [Apiospora kogelbergensis]|uniref:Zn(2)-C6 fungal-type DNA-binding domain protein n=1 Tax=Apiospora kogelbergensis TaxID=1337665 RepID=UPI00312D0FAE